MYQACEYLPTPLLLAQDRPWHRYHVRRGIFAERVRNTKFDANVVGDEEWIIIIIHINISPAHGVGVACNEVCSEAGSLGPVQERHVRLFLSLNGQ